MMYLFLVIKTYSGRTERGAPAGKPGTDIGTITRPPDAFGPKRLEPEGLSLNGYGQMRKL